VALLQIALDGTDADSTAPSGCSLGLTGVHRPVHAFPQVECLRTHTGRLVQRMPSCPIILYVALVAINAPTDSIDEERSDETIVQAPQSASAPGCGVCLPACGVRTRCALPVLEQRAQAHLPAMGDVLIKDAQPRLLQPWS
jgi:hypothetical protein